MAKTPKICFTPADGLMDIVDEFKKSEYCTTRSEAINRLLANSAKRWKASQSKTSVESIANG